MANPCGAVGFFFLGGSGRSHLRICHLFSFKDKNPHIKDSLLIYTFYVPFNAIDSSTKISSIVAQFFLGVFRVSETQDWRCFTYTVVPKIAMLEKFTLGPLRVTFRQWTFYIAVKSIITHAEVWSQGLLVASALRARDCRGAAWRNVGISPRFPLKRAVCGERSPGDFLVRWRCVS